MLLNAVNGNRHLVAKITQAWKLFMSLKNAQVGWLAFVVMHSPNPEKPVHGVFNLLYMTHKSYIQNRQSYSCWDRRKNPICIFYVSEQGRTGQLVVLIDIGWIEL